MIVFDFPQYSPEWFAVRNGIPTGSEFDRIVTASRWEYAKASKNYICELVAQMFGCYGGAVQDYQTAAMRNGTIMEPEARRFYEFSSGSNVTTVGFCLEDNGHYGCSPDALVGEDGVLELKHPLAKTHVQWLIAGEVPREYLAQVHGHLLVTGFEWCDFFSYCPPLPPLLVRVEADEKTEKLGEYLERFWGELEAAKQKVVSLCGKEATQTLDFGGLGTVEATAGREIPF